MSDELKATINHILTMFGEYSPQPYHKQDAMRDIEKALVEHGLVEAKA